MKQLEMDNRALEDDLGQITKKRNFWKENFVVVYNNIMNMNDLGDRFDAFKNSLEGKCRSKKVFKMDGVFGYKPEQCFQQESDDPIGPTKVDSVQSQCPGQVISTVGDSTKDSRSYQSLPLNGNDGMLRTTTKHNHIRMRKRELFFLLL